jgi:hypothetical protein
LFTFCRKPRPQVRPETTHRVKRDIKEVEISGLSWNFEKSEAKKSIQFARGIEKEDFFQVTK